MSFASMALKNVRGRFSGYLTYLVSATLTVTVFAIFAMIFCNPQLAAYRVGVSKISLVFRAAAVAVLVFAGVFVAYSNSFFLRSRKKEIAVYSLLGMRKDSIAKLLIYENLLIGAVAIALGTLLGALLSRFFTRLLMRMMALGGNTVEATVCLGAIVVTVIVFLFLFGLSSLLSSRVIYRSTLVELLGAEKEGEARLKFSPAGVVASVLLLTAGYVTATLMDVVTNGEKLMRGGVVVLALIVAGTALFFRHFVPALLTRMQRNKRYYYRPANIISTAQLRYRIRGNARLFSVAAILCAVSFAMTSVGFSMYRGLEDSVQYYAPYSYLCKDVTDAQVDELLAAADEIGEVRVTAVDRIQLLYGWAQCAGYKLSEQSSEGAAFEAYVLSASDYARVIAGAGTKVTKRMSNLTTGFSGTLPQGSCWFLDGNPTDAYSRRMAGKTLRLHINGADESEGAGESEGETWTVAGASLHKYLGTLDCYAHPTVVVDDAAFARYAAAAPAEARCTFTGLMFDDPMLSAATVARMNEIVPDRFTSSIANVPPNISYIGFYESIFALYGVYVFIALLIGLLFLLALGSILYYKQMMEAQQERQRYDILQKTGMRRTEALASVRKQLGVTFGLPLALGSLHAVFTLFTFTRMMMEIGSETPLFRNALLVFTVLTLLYAAFYVASVRSFMDIVWDKRR